MDNIIYNIYQELIKEEETQLNLPISTPQSIRPNTHKRASDYEKDYDNDWVTQYTKDDFFHADDIETKERLNDLLNYLNLTPNTYNINGKILLTVEVKNKQSRYSQETVYVVTDLDYPKFEEAGNWLGSMYESELDSYIPDRDFNKEFWDEVGNGSYVYHATPDEYGEKILKTGLKIQDKTRGINNRNTGAAIFTSENPDDIDSYGRFIIAIDLGMMKKDGYMPEVSKETPLEEATKKKQLADMIHFYEYYPEEEYISEGLYDSTVIFYSNIPSKYLKKYEN